MSVVFSQMVSNSAVNGSNVRDLSIYIYRIGTVSCTVRIEVLGLLYISMVGGVGGGGRKEGGSGGGKEFGGRGERERKQWKAGKGKQRGR